MITPHERHAELAEAIGVSDLYFKREDLHPYGSHKGRSIPVMIDHYCKKGDRRFAISSSGNAALAAALHVQKLNKEFKDPAVNDSSGLTNSKPAPLELDIFVGQHIAPHKLEKLRRLADYHIRVLVKERPLQAIMKVSEEGVRSLRQSTDDIALIGYEPLAQELTEIKDLGAVFIGTSSGTTAEALAQYFLKHTLPVQVHIIQTSACHPIADAFDTFEVPDEVSLAGAIVDLTGYRKNALVPLLQKTGGRGWCATNEAIQAAQELLEKNTDLEISNNSALSVVGAMQAAYMGYEIQGAVVCVICGE